MKRLDWQMKIGLILIVLSTVLYTMHYVMFHDSHHIFIYLMGDIAFVPIEVLLVTLIIHRLLSAREKRAMLRKMNMVIGSFYGEVGTELIGILSRSHGESDRIARDLMFGADWTDTKFSRVMSAVDSADCTIDCRLLDLEDVRRFLLERRDFMLNLLGNPNLLEHDSFTDMLWAVFHLTDELRQRDQVSQPGDNDAMHLSGDIKRAYRSLVSEWISYMKHLKADYPYLFSLAMRTNPFDSEAAVEIP